MDYIQGTADSRGKLIEGLINSIELFENFKKVVKLNPELKDKFESSIKSIQDSIYMIKNMDRDEFENLVENMNKNIYN